MTEDISVKSEPQDELDIYNTQNYKNNCSFDVKNLNNELNTDPSRNEGDNAKKRTAITLKQKLEIIKRYENKERTKDIMRSTGINESTLRSIRNNANKIKSSCLSGTKLVRSACKSSRMRPKLLEETEKLLGLWVEEHLTKPCLSNKKIPFKITLTEKALSIFQELKKNCKNPNDITPFTASNSWYKGFKKRYNLNNVRMVGDALGTSVFHKQRTITPPNVPAKEHFHRHSSELDKLTTNNELIIQPIYSKNYFNDGSENEMSDSDNSDKEFCESTLNTDCYTIDDTNNFNGKHHLTDTCQINGFNESFLKTILSQRNNFNNKFSEKRENTNLLDHLEVMLKLWIDNEISFGKQVTTSMIKDKSFLLYLDFKKSVKNEENCSFDANITWLRDFINKYNFENVMDDLQINVLRNFNLKNEVLSDEFGYSSFSEDLLHPETILEEKNSDCTVPDAPNIDLVSIYSSKVNQQKTYDSSASEKTLKNSLNLVKSEIKKSKVLNYGLNITAFMNMKNNSEKITNETTKIKEPNIIEETENLLLKWTKTEIRRKNNINLNKIQDKAMLFYEDLKQNYKHDEIIPFNASFSWLIDFKKRHNISEIKPINNIKTSQNKLKTKKAIQTKQMSVGLMKIEEALNIFDTCDSNLERKESVVQGIKRLINPYYDLLDEKECKISKLQ